jgi:hypothetical protein
MGRKPADHPLCFPSTGRLGNWFNHELRFDPASGLLGARISL